jgi:predicted transcriptional regulator
MTMKVCRVKVRIEPEEAYWEEQVRRVRDVEAAVRKRKPVRVRGSELIFPSLDDMARALSPKRVETLRLIRRHRPSSVRELAEIAGRDFKNVLADVRVLETLGLIQTEGHGKERHRKAPRTEFDRIDVQLEL